MPLPFKVTRTNLLPLLRLALGEALRGAWDRLRGALPREQRALDYVRTHATEKDPDSVLAALDVFGREHAFLMNVGDVKGEILDRAVMQSGAGRALEIGCYCGYSAVRIGRTLAQRGGHLTSIEASKEYAEIARQVVEFAGLSDVVEIRVGKAEELIPQVEGPFDLVFIDHWKDLYLSDLRRVEEHQLLRPGSVVVADNIGLFDASEYLAHVRDSGKYDSVHHEATVEYRDALPDAVEVSTWRG